MNTTQIMSTSPAPASANVKTQTVPKSSAAQSGQQKNGGFDDVLQKANTTQDASSHTENTAKDAVQDAKDAAKEAAQDDAIKAVGKDAKKTAKETKNAKADKTAGKDAQGTADTQAPSESDTAIEAAEQTLTAALLAGIDAAAAEAANLTEQAPTGVAAEVQAEPVPVAATKLTATVLAAAQQNAATQSQPDQMLQQAQNLHTLLPQDAAQGAKQARLLAMLSGTALTPEADGAQQLVAGLQNGQASSTENVQALTLGELSAQALPQQSQTAVQTQAAVQQPQAGLLAVQAQPQQADGQQSAKLSDFANLFGTSVETDGADSLTPAQQVLENALSQQAGQNAADGENSQQAFSDFLNQQDSHTQAQLVDTSEKAPQENALSQTQTATQGITSFSQTLAQQNVGEAQAPAAPQQPQQDYGIQQQIVDQARLIQRGEDTEMVIHLKPEHLGDLTLRVSVGTDGAVNASFHSNNAEVRTIIANTMEQLKTELNHQGIKVDNVGVYAGLADGGLPQEGSQQQAYQQGSSRQHSTRESAEAFEDGQELASALAAQREAATDGVDYRI